MSIKKLGIYADFECVGKVAKKVMRKNLSTKKLWKNLV
jgi:hypothetical protein